MTKPFLRVDEVRDDTNTTISGPSSARQQNAIKTSFCWCADDGPELNQTGSFMISGDLDQFLPKKPIFL